MKRKSQSFPLDKPEFVLEWVLKATDRSAQRRALAEKWLAEGPYSKYRYFVETCEDGKRVYLLRPTYLNRGFDFQVNVEGFNSLTRKAKGATREMPSHDDVIDDLQAKAKSNPKLRDELFSAVCDVYDCIEPDEILAKRPALRKCVGGLPIDKTLRIIKWLFIEQDLTYWNGVGRNMFMSAIEEHAFGIKA
jgi:hypothetical protein